MARKGRPPKPRHLHVMEGTLRPDRHGSKEAARRAYLRAKAEPIARCPSWLSAQAKKEWRRLAPLLHQRGLLEQVDRDALAAYCQALARWRRSEEFLEKHGEVYPLRDADGRVRYMQQFPQVAIAKSLLQTVRAYQQELGLTPAARLNPGWVEPRETPKRSPIREFARLRMEPRGLEP